jgi:Sulfotransferase family
MMHIDDPRALSMTATFTEPKCDRVLSASTEPLPGSSGPVLIIGAPRSGTSWLGKIFDSHPSVIYRHEPDNVVAQPDFPGICPIEDIPCYIGAAQRYVAQLTTVRQVKSSGTRPTFAKPFQPFPAPVVRRTLALALRVGEAVPPAAAWAKRIPIPDFISGDAAAITYVIKSVSLIGAVALLAHALPEGRIIAVFRHPCGQIASLKRAVAAGFTRGGLFGPRVLATSSARELGMTRERYEAMPTLDRWAWAWAFVHAKLFEEARDLSNVRLLRYESLCEAPIEQARELMAFARLPWAGETSRFIDKTTRSSGRERYFSLFRNPMEAATKWKNELSAAEIAHFTGIIERVLPGLFRE